MLGKSSLGKRIGRYLIEVIIIIIGITLSFALNEWNVKRLERADYYEYLENLKQDLKIDSIQMAKDIVSYSGLVKGTGIILRYDDKHRKDSLFNFAISVGNLSNFIEFLPNNNTFRMLSSIGGFKVFENKDLAKEMVQLYQYDYAFIKMQEKEASNERERLLEPYLFENIYFEDRETFPEIKTDVSKLIADPLFRNLCYSYGNSCRNAVSAYNRAIRRLNTVNNMINEELNKR